jgi:hypothetical protein
MSKADLPSESDYALVGKTLPEIAAPELPYKPPMPKSYRPKIALIGAGGISFAHLDAYRRAGLDVAAVMSRTLARATTRRDEARPCTLRNSERRARAAR